MITLPKPVGVNALYKISCRSGHAVMYKSPAALTWIEEAGYILNAQYKKKHKGDVELTLKVFYCGLYDVDSSLKIVLDLIQAHGIVDNDKQVKRLTIEKFPVHHRDEQKLEIKINEL